MTPPLICVVDASVAVKLCLAEALSADAHALFALLADPTTVFHVPDLFYIECANILWKQTQWASVTVSQAAAHYAALAALPLQRTPTGDLAGDALSFAAAHGITAYDACYVVLAQRHGTFLLTADNKLVQKLAGTSVAVTWLGSWKPPTAPP
jgi:predicted nucleic acid-binding protein